MDPDMKKKLIIGASLGAAIIAGIFIKNKLEETRFQPVERDTVIQIIKRARKENFSLLKQIAMMATQMAAQMKVAQADPTMVKAYLESPESPLKIAEIIEQNYEKVCESFNVKHSDFNASVEHYVKKGDQVISNLVEQTTKDYEVSLAGKLPKPKVTVPASLTKQRLVEVHKKITLKRYLLQVDVFRKLRGKSQQQIATNPEIMRGIPNPEQEQEKVLEQEGIGSTDEPASLVYSAAVEKFRNDTSFREALQKIENQYSKIFNHYKTKMQQNRITDLQLNQLQDELIYSEAM